nr:SDR family oxidoreductase [Streptomyces sp. NBC_00886]WSY58105.1 SDR family oxidoreductase [Streptomyces sp. NBC_00886]
MPARPRPTRPGRGRLPPAARQHDGEHPAHAVPTAQPPTASTTSREATARQATTPTGSPTLCPTSGNAVLKSGTTTASQQRTNIPLGRRGEAQEIAGWIVQLTSPGSSWVTGQVITIDGGLELR